MINVESCRINNKQNNKNVCGIKENIIVLNIMFNFRKMRVIKIRINFSIRNDETIKVIYMVIDYISVF